MSPTVLAPIAAPAGSEEAETDAIPRAPALASTYGTFKRLVDQGLAEELPHRPAPGDNQRRRYYRLSGLGLCAAEADRLASLVRITRSNLRPGMA